MYNSSCKGMFDLIRFSGTFYLAGRNIFFLYRLYAPGYNSPPPGH